MHTRKFIPDLNPPDVKMRYSLNKDGDNKYIIHAAKHKTPQGMPVLNFSGKPENKLYRNRHAPFMHRNA